MFLKMKGRAPKMSFEIVLLGTAAQLTIPDGTISSKILHGQISLSDCSCWILGIELALSKSASSLMSGMNLSDKRN